MTLDKLITAELEYFQPMLERQMLATDEQRAFWRTESISDRTRRVSLEVYEMLNGTVRYGPFVGLRLVKDTWWGEKNLGSQCLGFYERDILDLMVSHGPWDHFIDIGGGDGYYSVGMLHSGLTKRVTCFEKEAAGRVAIARNWELNNSVGDLAILGEASSSVLERFLIGVSGKTLVLIDVEGFEFELLDPSVIAALKECEVIIEVHNWVDSFTQKYSKLLADLFPFFEISLISRSDRSTLDIPELRGLTDDSRLLLLSEQRPCVMRFIHLSPRF